MRYDGNDVDELSAFLLTATEPVTVSQNFLTDEDTADMSVKLHNWIFTPNWAYTDVVAVSETSVSTRTRYFQRLWPPADWVWPTQDEDTDPPPDTTPTDPNEAPDSVEPGPTAS